jgi:hypothetical protein
MFSADPVFRGTRVPFQALLELLEGGKPWMSVSCGSSGTARLIMSAGPLENHEAGSSWPDQPRRWRRAGALSLGEKDLRVDWLGLPGGQPPKRHQ